VIFRQSRQKYLCGKCDHEFDAPEPEVKSLRVFLSYGHDEHAALAENLKRDLEARSHRREKGTHLVCEARTDRRSATSNKP
jgi:hypothetical protein